MQKKILSKVIAILLLLSLIMPTFGTTAYAVFEEVEFNQGDLKTSTRFVDASMSFLKEDESLKSVIADVGENALKFRLYLDLKDEGYLSGGQIEIMDPENLTYEFVDTENSSDLIHYVDSQTIKLNQIKGVSETFIEVLVKYTGADNVDTNLLFNKNEFVFTAEYTNSQGKKFDVYKSTTLNLNWIDDKEVEITNDIQKFIKYEVGKEKGVVLQNLLTIKNKEKDSSLPVQKVVIESNLLRLGNRLPKSVNVAIQNAKLLNDDENIVLDKEIYSWNKENNLLKIEVESGKNKDDTYSAGTGELEIIITSFYELENDFKKHEEEMNVLVKEFVLTGESKLTEVQKELKTKIVLEKEIGQLVDISEINETNQILKGTLYVNSVASNIKDNIVKSKIKLDISNVDIVDGIKIVENEPQYNNKSKEKNLLYNSIEINKKSFVEIFGEGYIDIYSGKRLIDRIDSRTKEKNGKLIYEFKEKLSNINLNTSKPIKEGEVFIEFTRSLNKASYNISTLKNLKSLNIQKKAYLVLNKEEKLLDTFKHNIKLVDAVSSIIVNTNKTELSTIKKNENIEFVISLNNDKEMSDVYGQTAIELLLPKGIKEFNVKNSSLMNGNGLKISSANVIKKDTQYIVQILLSGVQNGLNKGHLTNGTSIVLNTDITLDQWSTSSKPKYNVRYSNSLATNYKKPVKWNMGEKFDDFEKYGNGLTQGNLEFVAPKGLVLINEFNNYNKKEESVISINQGYKEGKLDILSGKRIVDGSIYLLNNSESNAITPTILGRLPNRLNKNIFTNESLGSTFDTVLAKQITAENGNATIYYSSNPNATNDLKNVSNGWTQTIQLKDVKSYLVVLNKDLAKGSLVKLNYGMEIPANLEHNQTVRTYSLVEYGTAKGNKTSRYYQMSSPVALSTGEGVQLEINIKSDKTKVLENEDIAYTLEVENKAKKTDAKNVESYFRIPDNLQFKGVRDDGSNTKLRFSKDKTGVYISFGDIKVGNTKSKELVFVAKEVKNDEEIELTVNTAADNFELVKSKKAVGSKIEGSKLSVTIKDKYSIQNSSDVTKLNIYPGITKIYEVTVSNTTSYSYNEKTGAMVFGEDLDKVNLTIQLPNTLEYVNSSNAMYKVMEYNKVTNILKIQLIADKLEQTEAATFELPLKLKEQLPGSYNKTVKLSANASTKGLTSKEDVSVQSNTVVNYIAEVKLNDSTKIYRLGDEKESALTEVQEYDDIIIKYSVKPTYNLSNSKFVFEAPEGIIVKGIYQDYDSNNKQSYILMGSSAGEGGNTTVYEYPFSVEANRNTNIYVHAYVEGIEEASLKTLSYKVGIENSKRAVNLTVKKGTVQNIIKEAMDVEGLKLSPSDKKKFGVGASDASVAKNSVLGKTWVENNETSGYQTLGRVNVELIDNNTQKIVAKTVSDENGKYQFDNIINGEYSVVFKYNEDKYIPMSYNVLGSSNTSSTGVKVNVENQGRKSIAVTDGIQVNFASVQNIDLGLTEKSNFDLSLDAEITEIEVEHKKKGSKIFNFNNRNNVKIELDRNNLNNSNILVKYIIRINNEGELEGNVLRIKALIPKGMKFVQEQNKAWDMDGEGNLYTTSLSANELSPGQSLSVPLILETEFNKETLGLSVLGVEIAEATNPLGLPDRDSTPNNMNTEEDDYINVELIMGLNTGKKVAYSLLVLTTIAIIGSLVFLVLRKINGKEIK